MGAFPYEDIEDLANLLEQASPGDGRRSLAVWVAETVDFRTVFPGPVGELLERIDDPLAKSGLFEKAVDLIRKLKPFRKKATVTLVPPEPRGN